MSDNTQLFELVLTTEAEVIRGCCGQAHEFGECPNNEKEASDGQD